MSSTEENEAIARRIFEEVWQNHNYAIIDELVAEDYILHDPTMTEEFDWPDGREGFHQMAEMGAEIVDGDLEIEQLISAGDYIIVRWKQTGTHVGQMGSIEPTNEEVTVTGIQIDRYEGGRLAETWQEVGMLPMLTKIGVISEDIFTPEMPTAGD